ncbi:MAG: NAD(P)/FAD-dependent oxidoreductase [Bacteroidales bacterium]|nr:NAD(P)/FAD-dependent oxidoreductase [Bacteroidales bacterium]
MKKVLIVGTGLGGLTTALRLAKLGYQVEMVEKYHQPGGRLNQLKKDGFTWDMAPTFFSMSYEFKEFVESTGIEMPFEFVELDPLYAVNFANSDKFYMIYKDLKKLAKEFEAVEPDFEAKMTRYLAGAGKLFHDTENIIIKQNFNSLAHFLLQMTRVPWVHAPKMIRSMWSEMERHFESREVKEIFSLVAFFLGATPFDTPAVYSLLSYTEMVHDGYHNVRGGMYKIVEGLMKEFEKENIKITFNTEITGYVESNGQLSHLVDTEGKRWDADIFVINADAAGFRSQIFKRPKFTEERLDRMKWTLAPFTMYVGVKGKIDTLHHHNYFLGSNFKEYAGKIFKNSISLSKPYYYVNVNSRHNKESAPEGCENLFILCPVPDLRFKPDWSDRDELADTILTDLSQRIGFDVKGNLMTLTVMDPKDWERDFNLYKGSGLGLAHDLNQIGGFRPKNYDEVFGNVFYVGASTTPGTGLPMTVISSRLVTERIQKKHGLILA